jgi:hypothetical protein
MGGLESEKLTLKVRIALGEKHPCQNSEIHKLFFDTQAVVTKLSMIRF